MHSRSRYCLLKVAAAMGLLAGMAGCSTIRLDDARAKFYQGQYQQAETQLKHIDPRSKDRVLALMERGMIRQAEHKYKASIEDWLEAQRLAEDLDYYSVSRDSASFLINDTTMPFRGAYYERTILHVCAAMSYLALSMWEDAAVEARNIIYRMENRSGVPDDPYSRYVAGLCLELINDSQGAALQYRLASDLLKDLNVDQYTGRITTQTGEGGETEDRQKHDGGAELVCFISMGRWSDIDNSSKAVKEGWRNASYAEIYVNDRYLGRSYQFADVRAMREAARKRHKLRKGVKTGVRIVLKEALVQALSAKDEQLGDLLRTILYELEVPDMRMWKTLPKTLQVARMPCPSDLKQYEVVFRNRKGGVLKRTTVTTPVTYRGNVVVSFCRSY